MIAKQNCPQTRDKSGCIWNKHIRSLSVSLASRAAVFRQQRRRGNQCPCLRFFVGFPNDWSIRLTSSKFRFKTTARWFRLGCESKKRIKERLKEDAIRYLAAMYRIMQQKNFLAEALSLPHHAVFSYIICTETSVVSVENEGIALPIKNLVVHSAKRLGCFSFLFIPSPKD